MRSRPAELPLTKVLKRPIDPSRYNSLSPRQKLVLTYIVQGYTTGDISRISGLNISTLGKHRYELLYRLGCKSTLEVILAYYRDLNPGMRFSPKPGHRGHLDTSEDNQEALTRLASGEQVKDIAADLGISVNTLASRLSRMRKTFVNGDSVNRLIILWLDDINYYKLKKL